MRAEVALGLPSPAPPETGAGVRDWRTRILAGYNGERLFEMASQFSGLHWECGRCHGEMGYEGAWTGLWWRRNPEAGRGREVAAWHCTRCGEVVYGEPKKVVDWVGGKG